jgi:hypothetical protein
VLPILLSAKELLGTDQIPKVSHSDPRFIQAEGHGSKGEVVVPTLVALRLEHDVDQPGGGDQSESDRRAEDVARFQTATVDTEAFRDVIYPPPRIKRVECVAAPLEVSRRPFRYEVDIDRLQMSALKSARIAPEHDVNDVVLV